MLTGSFLRILVSIIVVLTGLCMKVSLSWIFDHIKGSVHEVNVTDLITRFNESVAEIEGYYSWTPLCDSFDFVRVTQSSHEQIIVQVLHSNDSYVLPNRPDLFVGDIALVRHEQSVRWARMSDLGSSKESLLPSIDERFASWDRIESSDIILEIDNKSITHRPDLWSHRGLAREIAALLGLSLTNPEELFAQVPVHRFFDAQEDIKQGIPHFIIEKRVPCRRLAGAYVPAVWHSSSVQVLARLCRVDTRPVDALVDLTNYVMLDYGQPMHAFDAAQLDGHTLTARYAAVGEAVTVLDGDTLKLHSHDMVLADAHKVVSLPGVMGGAQTGVSRTTKYLLIEAGSFEPSAIRHTAARYAKRTEASMRFEKNLDPEMPAWALKRYIQLLIEHGISCQPVSAIVDCGPAINPVDIRILHTSIEQRLGMHVSQQHIITLLGRLDFRVQHKIIDGGEGYIIEVPSFRATKDIHIPEDIIEEIGRYLGYKNIPTQLPRISRQPAVASTVYRLRTLKNYCASALSMREISSYAFFDESWLLHLRWQPLSSIEALNPVSGNWRRLVSSLVPALLKAVHENSEGVTDLRYFEVGRTWIYSSPVIEKKNLAGLLYTRSTATDFYTLKEYVQQLCAQVGIIVTWRPIRDTVVPWYDPYCVAHCVYENAIVGTVGLIAQSWKDRVVQTGFLGAFELDAQLLSTVHVPEKKYKALPKYPDIVRDVSVRISQAITAFEIQTQIQKVDSHITEVALVDFFKKPEWQNSISLSFRYVIRDNTKTLTAQEADSISHSVEKLLTSLGGEIR